MINSKFVTELQNLTDRRVLRGGRPRPPTAREISAAEAASGAPIKVALVSGGACMLFGFDSKVPKTIL